MRDNQAAIVAIRRRLEQRVWSPGQFAKNAGVVENTVRRMLDGKAWPVPATRGKLEAALQWPPGRIEALALGNVIDDPDADTAAQEPPVSLDRKVFQTEYDGWVVTILPAEDATDDELETVAPSTIAVAIAKINEAKKRRTP